MHHFHPSSGFLLYCSRSVQQYMQLDCERSASWDMTKFIQCYGKKFTWERRRRRQRVTPLGSCRLATFNSEFYQFRLSVIWRIALPNLDCQWEVSGVTFWCIQVCQFIGWSDYVSSLHRHQRRYAICKITCQAHCHLVETLISYFSLRWLSHAKRYLGKMLIAAIYLPVLGAHSLSC